MLWATWASAASDESRCDSRKLRAVGSGVARLLECHAKSREAVQSLTPACRESALERLPAAFAMAEAAGGCDGTISLPDARRVALRMARRMSSGESSDAIRSLRSS